MDIIAIEQSFGRFDRSSFRGRLHGQRGRHIGDREDRDAHSIAPSVGLMAIEGVRYIVVLRLGYRYEHTEVG